MNFVVIEIGLREFPPLFLTAMRFILVAFPAVFFAQRPKGPIAMVFLYGIFMFALQFAFLFAGMYLGMPAGLASLVLQFQVIATVVLSTVLLREVIPFQRLVGIAVALCGLAIVAWHSAGNAETVGFVLVLCAAICWGVANIVSKKIGASSVLALVVWGSLVAPLPLLLASFYFEGRQVMMGALSSVSWVGIIALGYIVYPTTFYGFSIWSKLLNLYSTNMVAPFSLLVPVFGIFFSAVILSEPMPTWKLVASALVISGVAFNIVSLRPRSVRKTENR
ncbi:EamA family transporter [Paracoccus tegillarcae]|uniref:EamA family transporter n=1 Tax=Paracoccus tegillarcae TaxID=1529068 RepID=UPI0018E6CBE9|nr:EamA family transporter [Paracoccus tegillarcae]